jgi:phospholipid-transporting ATPase
MLRNTSWVFGIVLYTGHDTKLMHNSTSAPLKRSTVDKLTNTQILMLFFILIVLCLTSAIFNEIWTKTFFTEHWYLGMHSKHILIFNLKKSSGILKNILLDWAKNFAYNLLTFIILYNNLIPISLQVTLELVRFLQAIFINMDSEMYHQESDTPAMARTSNLNEELGMVKYVFTDKTGTLTRNVMEFKKCSIAGQVYSFESETEAMTDEMSSTSFTVTDGPASSRLTNQIMNHKPDSEVAREFMTLMAICHTVIPETSNASVDSTDAAISINVATNNEDIIYHAASPDERALVYGAKKFGFIFHTRTPTYVEMDALGNTERYEILNVLEFTSTRKRMSIIARNSRGEIKLYCKGADTVIFERLAPHGQHYKDITLKHLEDFANDGLRTLCFAVVDIPDDVYDQWKDTYHKASTALQNRERKVEDAASLIETNLVLLGATAIEDKLQEGVPETIAALLDAKIKVWVLTGDKQETAINIGYSCRLLQQGMDLIIMNEDSLDNTRTSITRHMNDLCGSDTSCSSTSSEHCKKDSTALIIDGKTLKYALSCELRREFYELCINCKCVICCRVSPLQKADCVLLVRECSKSKEVGLLL